MAEPMNYLQQIAARIREAVPAGTEKPEDESLYLIYATLLLAKGRQVTSSDVHDAWATWMTIRGEDHESIVPFDLLPDDVKAEDAPFVAAIRKVACWMFTPDGRRYEWAQASADTVVFDEPLFLSHLCEIWRGRIVGTSEGVVLKLARRDKVDVGEAVIDREVEVRKSVASKHLAEMLRTDQTDDGRRVVALRHYSLGSLADHLERHVGPLDVEMVATVARDVGSALVAVRDAGFVHSDVAPVNILRRTANPPMWVLADFGAAVPIGSMSVDATSDFAPWPLALGGPQTPADDTWDVSSLAQVLYRAITGEFASFDGDLGPPPNAALSELWTAIDAGLSGESVRLEQFVEAVRGSEAEGPC